MDAANVDGVETPQSLPGANITDNYIISSHSGDFKLLVGFSIRVKNIRPRYWVVYLQVIGRIDAEFCFNQI